MSEQYLFTTVYESVNIGDRSIRFMRPYPAWYNFREYCGHNTKVAIDRLKNEWDANLVGDDIVFNNEKDKLMWILRWS